MGMRAIMKISEWIKPKIKFDTALKLTHKRHITHHQQTHNRTRFCKKYINSKRRVHTVRIGNKLLKSSRCLKVICTVFNAPSYTKPSDNRNRTHKSPFESESFLIVIDNHTSTTISNKSSHLSAS